MKSVIRPLSLLAIVVFIIGTFALLYHLYFVLPEVMVREGGLKDSRFATNVIENVRGLLFPITSLLALGLLVFILLSINNKAGSAENVIYIERSADNKNKSANELNTDQFVAYKEKANELIDTISQLNRSFKDKLSYALNAICKEVEATVGVSYISIKLENQRFLEFAAGYAYQIPDSQVIRFEYGEGIAGQVAKEGKEVYLHNVPNGYIASFSGLGKSTPQHLFVFPIKSSDNSVVSVIEVASFKPFNQFELGLIREVAQSIL